VRQALAQIASAPDKFLERPGPGELQTIYSAVAQDIARRTSSLINQVDPSPAGGAQPPVGTTTAFAALSCQVCFSLSQSIQR
jgi:hypothetical protein